MYFGGIRIMKQGKKKDDYSFEFLYDKSKKSKSGKKGDKHKKNKDIEMDYMKRQLIKNTDMNMLLIMKIVNYRG